MNINLIKKMNRPIKKRKKNRALKIYNLGFKNRTIHKIIK